MYPSSSASTKGDKWGGGGAPGAYSLVGISTLQFAQSTTHCGCTYSLCGFIASLEIGRSHTWCVTPPSFSSYGEPSPSQQTSPPNARMMNTIASRGTSRLRKNTKPLNSDAHVLASSRCAGSKPAAEAMASSIASSSSSACCFSSSEVSSSSPSSSSSRRAALDAFSASASSSSRSSSPPPAMASKSSVFMRASVAVACASPRFAAVTTCPFRTCDTVSAKSWITATMPAALSSKRVSSKGGYRKARSWYSL